MSGTEAFGLEELVTAVREAGLGVLATVSAQGAPAAALVGLVPTPEGEIVLNTPGASLKATHLAGEPRVALVIGTGPRSIQVEGTAELVQGEARRRYERVLLTRFSPERVLDPLWAVVVVRPVWARRYDVSTHPATVLEADWARERPSAD